MWLASGARGVVFAAALAALVATACTQTQYDPWRAPASSAETVPAPPDRELGNHEYVPPDVARVVVHGVVHGSLAVMLVLGLLGWLSARRRYRAERAVDPKAPLRDGPAVVFGVVEPSPEEPDRRAFVTVSVTQTGTEWQRKGGWGHQWTEVSRATEAHPFWVRTDDGARVRVEPGDRVELRDTLWVARTEHRAQRVQAAELTAGKEVFVTGTLSGAAGRGDAQSYRGAAPALLRPTRGQTMVISTEEPGAPHRQRMVARRVVLLVAAVAAAACVVFATGSYTLLDALGRTESVPVTATREYREWIQPKGGRGFWASRYTLRATFRDGRGGAREFEVDCPRGVYEEATRGRLRAVPFVVLPGWPAVRQFGREATVPFAFVGVGSVVLIFAWLFFVIGMRADRPWYHRRVVELAAGRL